MRCEANRRRHSGRSTVIIIVRLHFLRKEKNRKEDKEASQLAGLVELASWESSEEIQLKVKRTLALANAVLPQFSDSSNMVGTVGSWCVSTAHVQFSVVL